MKCPACKTDNPATAKFCNECGHHFGSSARAAIGLQIDGATIGGDVTGEDKLTAGGDVTQAKGGSVIVSGALGDVLVNAIKIVIENKDAQREAKLALAEYLNYVINNSARLTKIPGGRTDREPPALADVYVPLNLSLSLPAQMTLAEFLAHEQQRPARHDDLSPERDLRALTVLEALAHHRDLVLLGKPGSGKSTFVSFVALMLARAGGGDLQALVELGENWTYGPLLPVRIVIRRFADYLAKRNAEGTAQDVWAYLNETFERDGLLSATSAVVEKVSRQAGALFLFDGLDEASDPAWRAKVLQAVEAFKQTAGRDSRFLITARPYAWPGEPAPRKGEYRLADFNGEQIEMYVERWCSTMVRLGWQTEPDAKVMEDDLKQAVQRDDLQSIVTVPLLLNMTASVRTAGGRFPDDRVDLYNKIVELMIETWNRASDSDKALLDELQIPGVTLNHLRGVLQRVAYDAHRDSIGKAGTADIDEHTLKRAFRSILNKSDDKAGIVIDYIENRAGLLIGLGSERPDAPRQYTFPHRTFQEYLAACHLSGLEKFSAEVAALANEAADHWREALIMAARIAGGERGVAAAHRLVELGGPEERRKRRAIEAGDWERSLLAGEQLIEIGLQAVKQDEANHKVCADVADWLRLALTQTDLPAPRRARAGDLLARLGDPRFQADHYYLPDEPLWGFVEIPEGPFVMGSDARRDSEASKDEQPQHTVVLPRYFIARYPVTVAQFQKFVEAVGYEKFDRNALRDPANRPARNLTWYNALDYCNWLTETLKNDERTPAELARLLHHEDWRVTLPSEAEWEKAARGSDRRIFPWGDEFDANKANIDETGIGDTSAVGAFPEGRSPYEVLDMSGNVWEWTRSLWGKDWSKPEYVYPYQPGPVREDLKAEREILRVLRGGSFHDGRRRARCAVRFGDVPGGGYWDGGVRVVVSPPDSGL